MQIDFTGRHFELDDAIKELAAKRLHKLDKFVEDPVGVQLVLVTEKNRHTAELHVSHRFGSLKATETADDMRDAIYAAADKAEKQARRSRKKFIDKRRRSQRSGGPQNWPLDILEAQSVSSEEGPKVVKTTSLPIKPMSIEAAASQLEDSKNDFFVFRDSDTEKVSVIYRRKDDNLGLIAPDF